MAFITSLRIKNFFSIKNEVTIDFKATPYNIENNPERLFEFNGEYYNKVISLYGANASGKTTVLKAIVLLSNIIKNEQSNIFPPSFKNKFAHLNSNSEIDISFMIEIGKELKKFIYTLKFKSKKYNNIGIEDEVLYLIENNRKQTIFNRKDKKIQNIDKKIQDIIFDNLNNHKSLFQEFKNFDKKSYLNNIILFFINIDLASNIEPYKTRLNTDLIDEKMMADTLINPHIKKEIESFLLRFLNSINLDVRKIEAKFKYEDGKEKEFLGLNIFHKIDKQEPLEFNLESDGTQMLMKILFEIFFTNINKSILVLDELDSIIHPMLVPIIINLLIKNDIQIIYSTHNIYNMKFLQNDEVFLIEKDKNHETTIKGVKDMPDIKGYKNLLTLYENNYLGGVPKIEEIITKIL